MATDWPATEWLGDRLGRTLTKIASVFHVAQVPIPENVSACKATQNRVSGLEITVIILYTIFSFVDFTVFNFLCKLKEIRFFVVIGQPKRLNNARTVITHLLPVLDGIEALVFSFASAKLLFIRNYFTSNDALLDWLWQHRSRAARRWPVSDAHVQIMWKKRIEVVAGIKRSHHFKKHTYYRIISTKNSALSGWSTPASSWLILFWTWYNKWTPFNVDSSREKAISERLIFQNSVEWNCTSLAAPPTLMGLNV
jgi:hypothetical protein